MQLKIKSIIRKEYFKNMGNKSLGTILFYIIFCLLFLVHFLKLHHIHLMSSLLTNTCCHRQGLRLRIQLQGINFFIQVWTMKRDSGQWSEIFQHCWFSLPGLTINLGSLELQSKDLNAVAFIFLGFTFHRTPRCPCIIWKL